jgi:protein-S-isoprenylcysteine O-methyltransferase Ste14
MMSFAPTSVAYVAIVDSYLLGAGSLLLFLLFLFAGSLDVVNLGMGEMPALCLDVGLSLVFFVQHSLMVRRSFRRWLTRFVRTQYHGVVYTVSSGIVLLIVVVLWQESARTVVTVQGFFRWLLRAVFLLSVAGFYWGIRSLGRFDPFGIEPVLQYSRVGKRPRPARLAVRGPYRWVRHPLYLSCLLLIWSCPDVTVDRLVFNVLWTAWVIVGTVFEERDLVEDFGEEYRRYQRQVPMLVPLRVGWHGFVDREKESA